MHHACGYVLVLLVLVLVCRVRVIFFLVCVRVPRVHGPVYACLVV